MHQRAIASAIQDYQNNFAEAKSSTLGKSRFSRDGVNYIVATPRISTVNRAGISPAHGFVSQFARLHVQPIDGWLDTALVELSEADDESVEEEFAPCSDLAKTNAATILADLANFILIAPTVYPTSDQEIAIQFRPDGSRASVLILCDSSGGGVCFSFIEGKNRRARFDDAADLPAGFVVAELLRLNVAPSDAEN